QKRVHLSRANVETDVAQYFDVAEALDNIVHLDECGRGSHVGGLDLQRTLARSTADAWRRRPLHDRRRRMVSVALTVAELDDRLRRRFLGDQFERAEQVQFFDAQRRDLDERRYRLAEQTDGRGLGLRHALVVGSLGADGVEV